jgi:hypothetical protein
MARRVFLPVLTLTLVAIALVGVTACGSGAAPTTTSVAPSVTAASSTTSLVAGAATTAGTATTAEVTTADTATQDEYKTKMSAWVTGPLQKLDTSVFDIPDPANATSQQIDAVAAFVSQAQAALDQLKTIKPSAEASSAHNQYVKAYEDLLAATEKYVSAMRSKDASGLASIEQAMSTAQTQIQQSIGILGPMIGLTPSTT